jgi:hypothetical protein
VNDRFGANAFLSGRFHPVGAGQSDCWSASPQRTLFKSSWDSTARLHHARGCQRGTTTAGAKQELGITLRCGVGVNDDSSSAPSPAGHPGDQVEIRALQQVLDALQSLSPEARTRIVQSAAMFFGLGGTLIQSRMETAPRPLQAGRPIGVAFSADTSMSPKEFLLDKEPRTDVERIACLAYYLTHYRDTPHFKTIDLSKLNTEAAQPKFSNAAESAKNAVKLGYLVASTKGQRQLSAAAERFVQALPDREAAQQAMAPLRKRRKPRRSAPARENQ